MNSIYDNLVALCALLLFFASRCSSLELPTQSCNVSGFAPRPRDVVLETWVEEWSVNQSTSLIHFREKTCSNETSRDIRTQVFSFCLYFDLAAKCMGTPNGLVFPKCKGTKCSLVMSWDAVNCMWSGLDVPFLQVRDAVRTPGSLCDLIENSPELRKRNKQDWLFPFPGLNGSPCFAPWPDGATFVTQIKCIDNLPEIHVRMDMGISFSKTKYSCLMAGKCQSISNPSYWICVDSIEGFKFPDDGCLGFKDTPRDSGIVEVMQQEETSTENSLEPAKDVPSEVATTGNNRGSSIHSLRHLVLAYLAIIVLAPIFVLSY